MPNITPFLWYSDSLDEVITYYRAIFPDFREISASPQSASFEIAGQSFQALNGGPHHDFSEAVSFVIECEDQAEVDHYWSRLTADGGSESMCGWLKDRYGLSWQVIPKALVRYLSDPDRGRAERVTQAMLKMRKIQVAELDRAAGEGAEMTAGSPAPAEVSLPSDREVVVTRTFQAPKTLVYRAWTEPALMKRWLLGYPGWTMPVCEMDVRVGGRYRWAWRSEEDGTQFGFHGVFQEVSPPTRIRHTQIYDPGSFGGSMTESGEVIVTLTLDEEGGITTAQTLIAYASKEARDAALSTGMTDGMEMSYRKLDGLLAEGVD